MYCRWSRVAALLAVVAVLCFSTTQATFLPAGVRYEEIECDIVVAGGSTAALAASLAAALTAPEKRICLLESTNWPADLVGAVDFGNHNVHPVNQPKVLGYEPADLLHKWIFPTINQTKNLRVFYNTVVKKAYTAKGPHGDEVKSILAVQRVPKEENAAWRNRLSEDLLDWYSLYESKTFNKKALHFSAPLFIEATEFGDLLVTADAPFAQGIDVFPLYMSIEKQPVKQPHLPPPRPRGYLYLPTQEVKAHAKNWHGGINMT